VHIDPAWGPAGLRAAARHRLAPDEVIGVVYAPSSIHLIGPGTIWYVGLIDSDVYTVICDQQTANTTIYEITNVRPAGQDEVTIWRRSRQP
jgi:hypothetical protein